ncbi:MAG: BTAD domain-containing putative transcriptional regulator [Ilumatobacteraceae bacterium]
MFRVALLGPVELSRDGVRIPLPAGKTTELVVRLALEGGGTVRSERLIEDLWGDQAVSTGKNTLQSKVSQLRRALADPSSVRGSPAGYSLAIDPSAVDALEVVRLADLASTLLNAGENGEALRACTSALEMFRGEILADAGDAEWLRPHRARLDGVHERLIEDEIAARLELGATAELIGELEALVARHPLRERLRGQLMLALYRSGRQADALRAYQTARTVLGEELGLEPGRELQRLEAAILNQDPDLDVAARSLTTADTELDDRGGNLPVAVSSFIGRSKELKEVSDLVGARRLVTLVGPGGAGKTRLALEASAGARHEFTDGVWLIELAPLRSGADVVAAAATALGLDDSDRLDRFVAQRRILFVLDNCEHVIDAAASLADRLLRAGAGVKVLATSRERLGVSGEVLYAIQSLDPTDAADLFIERAREGGMATATVDQSETIDKICAQLDRLPLALELAAARTRSLSLDEIADRVDDRFGLLTGGDRTAQPRHQTLRGVVDWSYELLFTEEQRLFRRLSVFAGGFGLQAAEEVGASDDLPRADVVDLLGNLVDKSLVTVSPRDGQIRYTLLQTLADYGRAQLQAAGELSEARDRHLAWVVELATEAESALRCTAQVAWVERTARERGNIRAALSWAAERGRADDAVTIVSGLAYGWYISGSIKDSRPLLVEALALTGGTANERRAVAHAWAGWMTQMVGGAGTGAVEHLEQAVTLGRPASARTFAMAAVFASLLRGFRGLTTEAIELLDEASARADDAGDRWGQAWVGWARSGLVLKAGDPSRATEFARASIEGFMAEGDQCGAAIAAIRLGELAELRGDYVEATSSTLLAYNAVMVAGARSFNGSVLATRLGSLAALQGKFDEAATWHERGLSRAREGEFPGAIAQAFSAMGEAARRSGDLAAAEAYHREALSRFDASGSVEGASFSLVCLGLIATTAGDPQGARDLHIKSLGKAVGSSDRRGVAMAIEGLADAEAALLNGPTAAALLGAADSLRAAMGGAPPNEQRACTDRAEARARSLLTDERYAEEWDRGWASAAELVAGLLCQESPRSAST